MAAQSPPVVFVYGALRSGTTLFRLMLESHPGIMNPGEADFLFDHLSPVPGQSKTWQYAREALAEDRIFRAKDIAVPDTGDGAEMAHRMVASLWDGASVLTLNIHRNAEQMLAVFPEARVIHLLRDPRDVARSSVGMGWAGNSYYGMEHWIETERAWDRAACPDARVLTVHFEALMADLEGELGRVCEFLGQPFHTDMLGYHANTTYGPPNPAIAQQWKRKASRREIGRLEGRIGDLLDARGYERAGAPVVPRGPERLWLAVENRLWRWRHNIRRYGAPLFFAHHAARLLGLRSVADQLARRQERIRVRHLQ